jgi:CO dehydrogenase maturation factor
MKISVCGKGGSGKSTIATLLALSSVNRGSPTLVIDSDESNSGLYRMLGFDSPPSPLMDLLGGKRGLKERMAQKNVLAQQSITLDELPGNHFIRRDGLTLLTIGKVLHAFEGCACPMGVLSREFLKKLMLEEGQVAIIDMEAGVEHFGRGVDETVDWVVLVVEPSFESVAIAKKIMALSSQMKKKVRAVINKVDSESVSLRLREELEAAGIPVAGTIRRDEAVFEACLEGRSLEGAREAIAAAGSILVALIRDKGLGGGGSFNVVSPGPPSYFG